MSSIPHDRQHVCERNSTIHEKDGHMGNVSFFFRAVPALLYYGLTILMFGIAIVSKEIYFLVLTVISAFFLFFSSQITIFGPYGLWKWSQEEKKDYISLLKELSERGLGKSEDFRHFIIIPNYKEEIEVLCETLDHIKVSSLSKTQIGICVAMEARELGGEDKAKYLKEKYRDSFLDFFYSIHPDIEGEVKGKGSNAEYGLNMVAERLSERGQDMRKVIFSICDADSQYHAKYFESLTYHVMTERNRDKIIWQAPIFHTINIVTVSFFTRITAELSLLHEVSSAVNPLDIHLPFSTYSFTYDFWKTMGGLDTDNIVEDWRAYLKSFLLTNGETRTNIIFLPTLGYGVESDGYLKSVKDRFVQAVRHAWGIFEICYFLQGLVKARAFLLCRTPYAIFYLINLIYRMLEAHAVPCLIFVYVNLGFAIFNYYKWLDPGSEEAYRVMMASEFFMQLNLALLILQFINMFIICYTIKKLNIAGFSWMLYPWYLIEFFVLSPLAIFVVAIIPGWYQATRLLWTDSLEYVVAPKKVVH